MHTSVHSKILIISSWLVSGTLESLAGVKAECPSGGGLLCSSQAETQVRTQIDAYAGIKMMQVLAEAYAGDS